MANSGLQVDHCQDDRLQLDRNGDRGRRKCGRKVFKQWSKSGRGKRDRRTRGRNVLETCSERDRTMVTVIVAADNVVAK